MKINKIIGCLMLSITLAACGGENKDIPTGNTTTGSTSTDIQQYQINVNSSAEGTVTGGGKYSKDKEVTVTATPTTGYVFGGWYENDILVSTENKFTFKCTDERNLLAKFGNTTVNYDLSIVPISYTFTAAGENKTFTVVCNKTTKTYKSGILINTVSEPSTEYTTSVTGVGFTCDGNKVTATDNNSTTSRTGTFTAIVADKSVVANLNQKGKLETYEYTYDLSVSPTSYTFIATGESKIITVICNKTTKVFWDGKLEKTTKAASTEYTTSVTGVGFTCDGSKVTATDNNSTTSRTGTFTAIVADKSVVANLNQKGKLETYEYTYDLSVSPTSYTFIATGGSKTFTVVCNKTTKVLLDGKLEKSTKAASTEYTTSVTGVGFTCDGSKVTATDNNSTTSRTGTFTAIVAGITKSVAFDQEGKISIDTNINP